MDASHYSTFFSAFTRDLQLLIPFRVEFHPPYNVTRGSTVQGHGHMLTSVWRMKMIFFIPCLFSFLHHYKQMYKQKHTMARQLNKVLPSSNFCLAKFKCLFNHLARERKLCGALVVYHISKAELLQNECFSCVKMTERQTETRIRQRSVL